VGKVGGAYVLIERPRVGTGRRFVNKKALCIDKLVNLSFFYPHRNFFWRQLSLSPHLIPQIFSHIYKNGCHRLIKRPIGDTDDIHLMKQNGRKTWKMNC
jgi:hypothetical protein